MLELRSIVKVYQGGTVNEHCLFDDFNLTIPDGQFVCVVGSNGSGKTSLLNIICGSIPIDEGCVMIGRENITAMPEHKRHRRIGRVYQDPARGTCPSMTILENMSMADNKGKPFNLLPCVNKKKTEEYRALLAQLGLGLEDKMGVKVGNLSGGQRQAMALLTCIVLVACLCVQIYRVSVITAQNKEIVTLTEELEELESMRENLKVRTDLQLNPDRIEDEAINRLGMYYPEGDQLRRIAIGNTNAGVMTANAAAEEGGQ